MKNLVILPTYNERENLPLVFDKVLSLKNFDVLVVDDNSSDGTKEIAKEWADNHARVNLLERPAKMGLGTAYITGFKWGLEKQYDCLIEMDSDLSHNPSDLPRLSQEIENDCGLVIGSRYIGGKISVVGWDFRRLLLSRFGNIYASRILKAPFTDMTSGFRAYSKTALMSIDLDAIRSEGYAFQIEMAYLLWHQGVKVIEIPIVFTERIMGVSKMSRNIIKEAVWLPWRLRLRNFGSRFRRTSDRMIDSRVGDKNRRT